MAPTVVGSSHRPYVLFQRDGPELCKLFAVRIIAILIIVSSTAVSVGCQSNTVRQPTRPPPFLDYTYYDTGVKFGSWEEELAPNLYEIVLNAKVGVSAEAARAQWMEAARRSCFRELESFSIREDSEESAYSVYYDRTNSATEASLCATAGAIGCVLGRLANESATEVRYWRIVGEAKCKPE